MKIFKNLLYGILGGALGSFIAFIIVFLFCWCYDKLFPTQNVTGGMMSVGWVFAFFAIPLFGIIGFIWFFLKNPF